MKILQSGIAGGAVMAILFLAMLLVPASYDVTVGSTISLELAVDDFKQVPWQDVHEALPGLMNLSTSMQADAATVHMLFRDTDRTEAKQAVEGALAESGLMADMYRLRAESIKKTVGGNALAAVTGGVIRIGVQGLSDAEVEAAITEHLAERGFGVRSVDVETTQQGDEFHKDISIEFDAENLPEGVAEGDSVYFEFQY
jgi:hypothetical protein